MFVTAAAVLGLKRPVRYSSSANLSVGHVYVSDPGGIPTIIEATRSLAATYSRAIHSRAVTADTRRRLAKGAFRVSGRLSATPIPDSQLITVSAESSSERGAIALANAGAAALAAYTNRQVRDNNASRTLAKRYGRAALNHRRRVDTRDGLERQYTRNRTAENKAEWQRAAAAADTSLLRREALRASYQAAVQGGTSSVAVESFSRASTPSDDRLRTMQVLLFLSLIHI